MKLAMMSCVIPGASPQEVVRTAAACNLDAIDWVCTNYKVPAKELRKLSLDNGLKIIAHTIWDSKFLQRDPDALDDFKRSLEFACELGAPILMQPPFPRVGQVSMEDDRRAWTEFYAETLPLAQAAGITLSLESTGYCNSPIVTTAEVLAVLHAVPGLKCTLDVGNMETAEPSMDAYFALKDHVVQFHLKDWKISDTPVPGAEPGRSGKYFINIPIGEGIIDAKTFWDTVDARGRELYVNLETNDFAGTSSHLAVLKRTAEFLRNL